VRDAATQRHRRRPTCREIEVLTAVLATGSEKAAAHCLGISAATVKSHLANARSKCGVDTTLQLVQALAPQLPLPNGIPQKGE
jgi:DNA-binding NarL/FixJ family response regulator